MREPPGEVVGFVVNASLFEALTKPKAKVLDAYAFTCNMIFHSYISSKPCSLMVDSLIHHCYVVENF